MEDYLIYLIPGIISFSIYRLLNKSIPHEKSEINLIIKYLVISLESYLWILFSILIFDRHIMISTSLDSINLVSIISSYELWKIILLMIVGVLFPILSRLLYVKLFLGKGSYNGSAAYTEFFLKNVFVFFDQEEKPFDISNISRKKIMGMVKKKTLSIHSKPIRIKKDSLQVNIGQIEVYYEFPWEFKELLIDHTVVTDNDYGQLEKTYLDLENNIEINIYKFKD